MTTGRCSAGVAGRPKITPVVAQYAFLVPKTFTTPAVSIDGTAIDMKPVDLGKVVEASIVVGDGDGDEEESVAIPADAVDVELIELAVARSGDKGNDANIGVIARAPEYLPWIKAALTEEKVRNWFDHFVEGECLRYDLPGLHALNFYLKNSLGGGGTSSMHLDSQAKTYAQQILTMKVKVPSELAAKINNLKAGS